MSSMSFLFKYQWLWDDRVQKLFFLAYNGARCPRERTKNDIGHETLFPSVSMTCGIDRFSENRKGAPLIKSQLRREWRAIQAVFLF